MDNVILVKVLFDLQEQFCPSVNEYKAFNVFISVKKILIHDNSRLCKNCNLAPTRAIRLHGYCILYNIKMTNS